MTTPLVWIMLVWCLFIFTYKYAIGLNYASLVFIYIYL